MKTYSKLFLVAAIGIASLAIFQPATSLATQMSTVGGYGPWQTGSGGEFTFQSTDLSAVIANYYSGAKNQVGTPFQPNFQTFCVEGGEFVNANTTYNVFFSGGSIASGDPLTAGASLLYSQFANGLLASSTPGYDYANTTSRLADADALQRAIWHYMGGQEGQGGFDSSNKYEVYAAAIFGNDAGANTAVTAGTNGVFVVNMYNLNGTNAQDMLIWGVSGGTFGVPDGGTTAMLLGVGLVGLFLGNRKWSRKVATA